MSAFVKDSTLVLITKITYADMTPQEKPAMEPMNCQLVK